MPNPDLSVAELRVAVLLDRWLTYQEIADLLHVSRATVASHAQAIFHKTHAHNRSQAVARLHEMQLIPVYPAVVLA